MAPTEGSRTKLDHKTNRTIAIRDRLKSKAQKGAIESAQLKQLLLSKSDDDKVLLSKLTICVKFMHSMPGFDSELLHTLDAAVQTELEPDQTHISERRFIKVAEPILKIGNLSEHRLFEVIKEACLDTKL